MALGRPFIAGSQAALADFGTLVNVYTNNFSVVCLSCIQSRCPDTAAAGEYNLCSVCIPALHTGGDGVIAVELAAIVIFYVYIYAVFFSSSVDTLYITVTETDNGRNSDTAEETKTCVAVFLLQRIQPGSRPALLRRSRCTRSFRDQQLCRFYNITFGNIDCDEGYIRIGVLLFSDGRSEQVTWHYNNGSTLGNSKIDGVDTLFIGILCRFVVLVLYAVCIAVGAYSFPGDLVEGFVGDISGVCDHGNFLTCGVFFFSPSVEAEAEVALVESAPVDASEEEDPLEEPHPASAAVVMAAASSKLTTFFFIIVFSFQEVQRFLRVWLHYNIEEKKYVKQRKNCVKSTNYLHASRKFFG